MTISLSFHDDTWRVRLLITDRPDGTVRVERSTNGVFWRPVRGGDPVEVVDGTAFVDDWEYEEGVLNTYRVVPVDPPDGVESDTITPSHNGRIILKSVRFPFVNRPVTVTDFTDPELGDRGGLFEVSGRAVPVSTPDQRASNAFEVEIMTETRQQARDVQLILRANPHLFLHTPADCPVPGGHVRVGTVPPPRRATRSASSDRRYWRLPCRLVAPPSPTVVAGTMTYAGLLNLYGGYDNVLAANPAYADLLELMGSPEDLVVV